MTTLFSLDQKLYKWSNNALKNPEIKFSDFVTITYRKFHIVSSKFDTFGYSQVMIVSNIKSIQTKESAQDSIVYYDTEATVDDYLNKQKFVIDDFKPSKYGNPVVYYNPAYQNGDIIISTRVMEIDESRLKWIDSLFGAASNIPVYGKYISLAGSIVTTVGAIVENITKTQNLCHEHVISLGINDSKRPFYTGIYVCFPNVSDKNKIRSIIDNYELHDYTLIKNVGDKIVECDETYFVLEISNTKRADLFDFDFVASSNTLLQKINKGDEVGLTEFSTICSNSNDFEVVQKILDNFQHDKKEIATALYSHLRPSTQQWFAQNFENIRNEIKL
jgi:hypothetical protein